MHIQEQIARSNRTKGDITWILKSAIDNPNVMIVVRNQEVAKDLKIAFELLVSKSIWYKKLYWNFFGRANPVIVSMYCKNVIRRTNLPIVLFDNSSMIS